LSKTILSLLSVLLVTVLLTSSSCTETKYVNQTILATTTIAETTVTKTITETVQQFTQGTTQTSSSSTLNDINSITAEELYNIAKTNSIAFEMNYLNKTITVTGEIVGVHYAKYVGSEQKIPYIKLYAATIASSVDSLADWDEDIKCYFESSYESTLALLTAGQTVIIQGDCNSKLELHNCLLIISK